MLSPLGEAWGLWDPQGRQLSELTETQLFFLKSAYTSCTYVIT